MTHEDVVENLKLSHLYDVDLLYHVCLTAMRTEAKRNLHKCERCSFVTFDDAGPAQCPSCRGRFVLQDSCYRKSLPAVSLGRVEYEELARSYPGLVARLIVDLTSF